MVYDTGYQEFWEMKKETAWGTAVVPDADVGLLEATGSYAETQGVEENFGVGSRLNNQNTYGKYGVSGSLTGSIANGRLLAYTLGADSAAGTEPTTHTITNLATAALSSFTLTKNMVNTDKGYKIAGCKINDVALSLETGGKLSATYNWIGKDVTTIASTVGTRPGVTETILPAYTGTVSWASGEIEVSNWNFNYNNNLGDDEYSISDRRRKAITEGQVTMNGSFTAIFTSHDIYDDFKTAFSTGVETGTARAMSLVATTGATTSSYELSLALTDVNLTELNSPVNLDNKRVVAEFSYIPKALGTVTYKDQFATTYIA